MNMCIIIIWTGHRDNTPVGRKFPVYLENCCIVILHGM